MLFEASSAKSIDEIDRGLQQAAARHKFGILGVHDLRQKMRDKGVEFDRETLVYEVCNPHQAKQVLERNGAISTALPCRISVYRDGDRFKIATLLPTALLRMFGNPELDPVAAEVEEALLAIIRESA